MDAQNVYLEKQTKSQIVSRHKRVNGKDRKKANRGKNEKGYSQQCPSEGWKSQPPAKRCMTDVCHQDKSSLLDLLQEQIFQRFRFGKQTRLDHSEELIGDLRCQTHRSQGLPVVLKITPIVVFWNGAYFK